MGAQKKKTAPKRKILTKRQKVHRRVARVHKAVARKKQDRQVKKKKASSLRKKIAATDQKEIVQMAQPMVMDQNPVDVQMNILDMLGLNNDQKNNDWENILQKKLKQADQKSLDNPEVKRIYSEIGKIFTRYRSGKIPKAFKIIPNLEHWRQVVAMTRPEQWTSHAMLQAINIFASNFDPLRTEEFYRIYLVPAVRRDLAQSKKLNVHLYDALKKGLYKTNAWFKGILFEFCGQGILLRQTKVIESLISKMSIPVISASVAMLKLMEMSPTTSVLHYLSAFLGKHYTLPKRVLNALTSYLLSFSKYEGELSVTWQGLFLTLVKQYGQCLDEMAKSSLKDLSKVKYHKLITPQILKHLT